MKIMSEKRFREEVEREIQEELRFERLRLEIDDRFRGVYSEIERLRERVSELERKSIQCRNVTRGSKQNGRAIDWHDTGSGGGGAR